jgi:hypothetical protein
MRYIQIVLPTVRDRYLRVRVQSNNEKIERQLGQQICRPNCVISCHARLVGIELQLEAR